MIEWIVEGDFPILNPLLNNSCSYVFEYVEGIAIKGLKNLLFVKFLEKEKIWLGYFSLTAI